MTDPSPFERAQAPAERADPYPLYAAMPTDRPVLLEDGRYVVSDYATVLALLHDPRLSSATPADDAAAAHPAPSREPNLLRLDPPEHDRLRRILMRQFGPPHRPRFVADLERAILDEANRLVDAFGDEREVDVYARFARQLPLATICTLFDLPAGDRARFEGWVETIVSGLGDRPAAASRDAYRRLTDYLTAIAASRRGGSGTDMISGLVNDDGPDGALPAGSLGPMLLLLLVAGHETTIDLIGNGIVTLVRRPDEIERLRADPSRVVGIVEELLRFEPPIQYISNRRAVADVEVRSHTIPAGSRVVLLLAAANRDADRFADPARFDPARAANEHLGFGSGIHSCFGAPLARLETQLALGTFFARVRRPRLAGEPGYAASPLLRGPNRLRVAFDGIEPVTRA